MIIIIINSQEVPEHQVSDTDLSVRLSHAPLGMLEADLIESSLWGAVHARATVTGWTLFWLHL